MKLRLSNSQADGTSHCAGCSGLCGWKAVQHALPAVNSVAGPVRRRLLPLAALLFGVPLLALVSVAALVQGAAPAVQLMLLVIVVVAVCGAIIAAGERISDWAQQPGRRNSGQSNSMHQA